MILNENEILRIINGSALLASGGGGSIADGQDLLRTFKKNHPDKTIEVNLISVDDMDQSLNAVILAGMGAPTKGANKDFSNCATGCYDEISKIAIEQNKKIGYTMPIEMGGFNTFAPMLVSLMEGYPIIDADGAGRAVPGLDTVLVHVNGYNTSPLAMAGENDDRVEIKMKDPKNAKGAQAIAAPIANGYFDGNAGIAGWIMSNTQIQDALPTGTITMAREIGIKIEEAVGEAGTEEIQDIFDRINEIPGVEAETLTFPSAIDTYTPNPNPHYDNGYYYLGKEGDFGGRFKVLYENESLVLYKVKSGKESPYMTAPDIITMYNAATGDPVTNEDIDQNYKAGTLDKLAVVLGVIKVDTKWWKNATAAETAWRDYFLEVGYEGSIIRYENRPK